MLLLLLIYNDIFYYDTTTSKRIGFNSFSNIGDDFRRLAVKTCRRSNSIIKRTDAENLTTRNVPCTCTPTISIEWHILNYIYLSGPAFGGSVDWMYGQVGVKYSYAVSMQDRSGRGERFGYVGKGLLEGVKALVKAIERPIGGFHVTSSPPYWWTVNKRLLISSFCLSTSICSFHHCYLCLPRLHENHLSMLYPIQIFAL